MLRKTKLSALQVVLQTPDMKMEKWLDQGLGKSGKSGAELARLLKIKPDKVSKMRKGARRITAEELPVIEEYLGEPAPIERGRGPRAATDRQRCGGPDRRLCRRRCHGAFLRGLPGRPRRGAGAGRIDPQHRRGRDPGRKPRCAVRPLAGVLRRRAPAGNLRSGRTPLRHRPRRRSRADQEDQENPQRQRPRNLLSNTGEPPIEAVEIEWAARVKIMTPR